MTSRDVTRKLHVKYVEFFKEVAADATSAEAVRSLCKGLQRCAPHLCLVFHLSKLCLQFKELCKRCNIQGGCTTS